MAVKIRLKKTGSKNNACYRVVVMDIRSSRDGRAIETLGFYDPRHKDEKINVERAEYWLANGAKPSETVEHIIKRQKEGKSLSEKEKKQKPSKKSVAKAAAQKEAEEKAKQEAAEAATKEQKEQKEEAPAEKAES